MDLGKILGKIADSLPPQRKGQPTITIEACDGGFLVTVGDPSARRTGS